MLPKGASSEGATASKARSQSSVSLSSPGAAVTDRKSLVEHQDRIASYKKKVRELKDVVSRGTTPQVGDL